MEERFIKTSKWYCSCGCVFTLKNSYGLPYIMPELVEDPSCPKKSWFSTHNVQPYPHQGEGIIEVIE